ncbi:hypothetical protein EV361DRAFT_796649 [Lentinula raphanica]|uniref:Microbial-type PARG catalytic domain-containing protein n=1 Tax=Lentinula raphanica TaxID=153919 RepID=A0AA38P4J2_9AGAR|nr:hypothetical protein F5878DRAFT_277928 [Lentinula raphanica]KAJ3973229.1 hypothetical protein EV361DRAFT_796649 [Lentinula raphanica]
MTAPRSTLTWKQRRVVCQDTIARSPSITASHATQGATLNSTFISEQLPPLPSLPDADAHSPKPVLIVNSDSFTLARQLIDEDPENATGKMAVLNLASDEKPGGGWDMSLSTTQEEALCYSSTLFSTLSPSYYPWPNLGPGSIAGVYSPGVVIFKHDLDHDCVDLAVEERCVVSVLTVAAPRGPKLTEDKQEFVKESDLEDLRGKIRLVYRMAGSNDKRFLVLGAMGCGAYMCPPLLVATEMRNILLEPEFKGHFTRVVFAVYSAPGNGARNFEVFEKVFKDVVV